MLERVNLLLVLGEEHVGKAVKRFFNVASLQRRHLEKLKTYAFSECHAILRPHCYSILKINLIGDDNASKVPSRVLLLDALQPLPQQVEGVRVGHVIDQHYHVGLAQQLERYLLEYVLPRYVNEMKFHSLVSFALDVDFLDVVLAALRHHVVVVEGALDDLVDQGGLADGGLACYDNSRSQDGHI